VAGGGAEGECGVGRNRKAGSGLRGEAAGRLANASNFGRLAAMKCHRDETRASLGRVTPRAMKTTLVSVFALGLLFAGGASVQAQTSTTAAASVAAATDEMEQLVAPIALYPDVLVALILPAAIESADVVLAARFLERGGAEGQIDGQPWDDSVKGLARYPDVVKWMDENLPWTRQLGDAYLDKPEEVMAAIQRVRARAKAQGLLVSTAEQQVVVEGQYIRILPAQPNVVYVPRYDPEVIFVERPVIYHHEPWITFGVGFGVGWWLGYDCDWGRRVIVVNPHYRHHWRHHHDWRHHRFADHHRFHHDWKPWTPHYRHQRHPAGHHNHFNRPGREIARPTPHLGAPRQDWNRRWDRKDQLHTQGPRDGHRNNFGRNDGPQRKEAARPPAVSTWRAGPRGQAIQQPPPNAQVGQRQEANRREWRQNRDGNGDRPREQRREFSAKAPQVVATPPAGTLRQPPPRVQAPQPRPQFQPRPQPQRQEVRPPQHVQQRPSAPPVTRQVVGSTPQVSAPRVAATPTPRVAATPTPRVAPAPQRSPSVGHDAGARPAPRMSTPSAPAERGGGGVVNPHGGHRGSGRGRSER
jgi:Protein of unknown function (DUF3300).